jgi:hypothetical protein
MVEIFECIGDLVMEIVVSFLIEEPDPKLEIEEDMASSSEENG